MATDGRNYGEWHEFQCDKTQFNVPKRYKDLEPIGQGAFGAVVRATDEETEQYVAIKKMINPFETKAHAKRTYRELKLLMHLNHPDAQIIQLYDVFTPDKSQNDLQSVYFVFNFVDYDLNRVIRRRKPFSEEHIRLIVYSLLRGIKFIHSAGILHRDLKPANIGIDKNSNLTILDFGLARTVSNNDFTGYVATRWWRAPEVYLNERQYDAKLDLWSIGCIMAELVLLEPIFRGTDQIDQINKIFSIIGTPNMEAIKDICTPDAYTYLSRLEKKPKANFQDLFGYKYDPVTQKPISGLSPEGIDLLDRLLSFDPRLRPTAAEALAHPFLEIYHNLIEEPTMDTLFDEHENENYDISRWKLIVWQMIEEFLPPSWVTDNLMDDS